ncbi:hypothetical protein EOL96_03450 [Candidatus Saccharibacteria bacterium]|nr:hypothetical protein [Candidatus Saccharibacteria bacterium]
MKPTQHNTVGSLKKEIPYFKKKLKTVGAAVVGLSHVKPTFEISGVTQLEDFREVFSDIAQVFAAHHSWEDDYSTDGQERTYFDDLSGTLTGEVEVLPASVVTDVVVQESNQEAKEGEFEIETWVKKNLDINYSVNNVSENTTAEGHEEEIIQYVCDYVAKHDVDVNWWSFRSMLGKVSVDTLRLAVRQGAGNVLYGITLPEGFTFDQTCVDDAIAKGRVLNIFNNIGLLDKSMSLQSIVDALSTSQYPFQVVAFAYKLPKEIIIPVSCVESAIRLGETWQIIDLINAGRLRHIARTTLRKMFLTQHNAQWCAFKAGLMSDIPADELVSYIDGGDLRVGDVFRHMQEQDVDLDEACMQALVDNYPGEIRDGYIRTLSLNLQSSLFDYYCKRDINDLEHKLDRFNNLGEEQYKLVLERWSERLKNYDSYEVVLGIFSHANESIKAQLTSDILPVYEERDEARRRRFEENGLRKERRAQEEDYFAEDSYVIDVHSHDEYMREDDIIEGLENEHCVRRVARLVQQGADKGRKKVVVCVAGSKQAVGAYGELDMHKKKRSLLTEHKAIAQFVTAMERLEQLARENNTPEDSLAIRNIIDNVTFIGEPEYQEATKGIAMYWKHLLQTDPEMQLLVLKGAISKNQSSIKSDEYMFDRILAHFSNQELAQYKGRLIVDANDLTSDKPQNIRTILLDDWTISGSQLRAAAADFIAAKPDLVGTIEVQLIAASKERVALGLERTGTYSSLREKKYEELPVLVRAYFLAHDSGKSTGTHSDTHGSTITGAHSAVDFGFENAIEQFCSRYHMPMPPLTNIVRPYRLKGYKRRNIERYYKMTQQKGLIYEH